MVLSQGLLNEALLIPEFGLAILNLVYVRIVVLVVAAVLYELVLRKPSLGFHRLQLVGTALHRPLPLTAQWVNRV